jgi:hypothetical protein
MHHLAGFDLSDYEIPRTGAAGLTQRSAQPILSHNRTSFDCSREKAVCNGERVRRHDRCLVYHLILHSGPAHPLANNPRSKRPPSSGCTHKPFHIIEVAQIIKSVELQIYSIRLHQMQPVYRYLFRGQEVVIFNCLVFAV